eukprot:gene10343-11419_t
MPVLEKWDPRLSVIGWLKSKERRQKESEKGKRRRWFKGVYTESESVALGLEKEDSQEFSILI